MTRAAKLKRFLFRDVFKNPQGIIESLKEDISRNAASRPDHAGQPVHVDGLSIQVGKRHPDYELYSQLSIIQTLKKKLNDPKASTSIVINSWYSRKLARYVHIERKHSNKKSISSLGNEYWEWRQILSSRTYRASSGWNQKAEMKAMLTLQNQVTEKQFRDYFLTGEFIEKSRLSSGSYLIRKSRPTIYINSKGREIVALCLHPLGYYEITFAGCQVPTDDVICHLSYIRSRERKFWAVANHHPLWLPTAGV